MIRKTFVKTIAKGVLNRGERLGSTPNTTKTVGDIYSQEAE